MSGFWRDFPMTRWEGPQEAEGTQDLYFENLIPGGFDEAA